MITEVVEQIGKLFEMYLHDWNVLGLAGFAARFTFSPTKNSWTVVPANPLMKCKL